jgi:hypothetical protein
MLNYQRVIVIVFSFFYFPSYSSYLGEWCWRKILGRVETTNHLRWVDLLVSRSLMIEPNTLYYITIHYVDLENFSGILWWAQVPLPHVLDDQTVVLVFSLLHPWQHPEIVKQWFQHPYTVRQHHGSSSGILSTQFTHWFFWQQDLEWIQVTCLWSHLEWSIFP